MVTIIHTYSKSNLMENSPQFYLWKDKSCAYTVHTSSNPLPKTSTILLIHPIGVGLSGVFWQPFIDEWLKSHPSSVIYNPDLLGCGSSEMPSVAYYPVDWAFQLKYLLENIIKNPVTLIVQGASFPIAIKLLQKVNNPNLIQRLVLSTPPAWRTMTQAANPLIDKLLWNLVFDSPLGLGQLLYRYVRRRQFIESFSVRQLFADALQVDQQWLDSLVEGAKDLQSRYAVFSFLAGFWREDYTAAIESIEQPTLVVWGEKTSSISREGVTETLQQRDNSYGKHLPQAQVCTVKGRNVLPFESPSNLVKVITDWERQVT